MNSDASGDAGREVGSREFYEDRARAMFRLRTVEGLTLKETGARFGVSRTRAHQIIHAYIRETTGRRPDPAQISRDAAAIRRTRRLDSIINAYIRETTVRPADPAQLSRAAAAIRRRGKLDSKHPDH
jgi:hypothetical protein